MPPNDLGEASSSLVRNSTPVSLRGNRSRGRISSTSVRDSESDDALELVRLMKLMVAGHRPV
jgi:hypothetical protein